MSWEHTATAPDRVEELAAGLGEAVTVAADLTDPDAAGRLFDEVERRLGPVDILVNNAAHCESPDRIDTATFAALERNYRVDAIAPALLISELSRRGGTSPRSVVNISTDAARAFPGQIGYRTSKPRWKHSPAPPPWISPRRVSGSTPSRPGRCRPAG